MSKVIIIGAGMGGLLAGNLLAKRGHRVKIFESHSAPGGYTAGFRRKGFYFESGTVSFESSKQVFKAMRKIGVLDRIRFVPLVTRWVSQDFDDVIDTYEAFKEMFYQAYPAEHGSLDQYFAALDKMYYATRVFIKQEKAFPASFFATIAAGLKMIGIFRKYSGVTMGDFTGRFFDRNSRLYRAFNNLGYPEMSAFILGGAAASIFDDYWAVEDGMQSWADLLAENFTGLGGELSLRSYVDKIITRDSAVVGVICNGETHLADYVIAAGDYKKTFLKLLDDRSGVPESFLRKVKDTHVSEGMAAVYLGLSLPGERLREYMKAPHIYYLDLGGEADISNTGDRDYFKKAGISLYSPSLFNPALAPEGKSSLMLQSTAPTGWMENWGGGDREKYLQLKEQVAEAMIEQAADLIPNLRDFIEYKDAATPLTYERYTHNTNGASSAWSWNPENKFYDNFMKSYVDTPVKNLYIGSCWAMQIGGIPGAIYAAHDCVKRIK